MSPIILSISRFPISCLIVFTFLSTRYVFSQTTVIPDANFEQVLVDLNIDTNGLNGNILNSDANVVYFLNVSHSYIDDLSGIQAFVNLKTLDCSVNNLTHLNIAENIELLELNVNDNQLASINLSQNIKLQVALLSSNMLNAINISNNLQLKELGVNLNNLTELVVTNNLNLEHLGCYSNDISNIDLTNNRKLNTLHIGVNNLSTLNISQNTNLQTLTCNENNLSEISLNSNAQLTYFDSRYNNISSLDISANPVLERLFVSDNNLNEVALYTAPNLKLFYAENNHLTTLNICLNSSLKRLKCAGNNLSLVDIRNGNNGDITEFEMSQNSNLNCIFVDDASASYLAHWIIDDTCVFVENESDCEALSTKAFSLSEISMYPNPTRDSVTFTVNIKSVQLKLFNSSGQLVHSQELNYGESRVDLSSYRPGVYLVKMSFGEALEIKKLVIK